jgi:hypothetical protein
MGNNTPVTKKPEAEFWRQRQRTLWKASLFGYLNQRQQK